jgi:hypothetical protein
MNQDFTAVTSKFFFTKSDIKFATLVLKLLEKVNFWSFYQSWAYRSCKMSERSKAMSDL